MDTSTDTQKLEAMAEAGPGATMENGKTTDRAVPSETDASEKSSTGNATVVGSQNGRDRDEKTPAAEAPVERSRGKIALIMLSLGMAVFLAAIDVTIVTTALPTISAYFHSSAGYTWIGSAYLLGNAAGTPIWGKFSDIWGRKPVLLIANAVFFVGSLIAALSTSIGMLITARAIQGIGGGGLVVLVNICIGDLFSQRRRGAYYGIIGGVWAIASSLGPILGGVFTEKVSWRWCFYINLPIDGIAFAIIFFFLDLKTPKTALVPGLKAIDWLGSLLIIGGTLMVLFGLEYGGQTEPWNSATVICLIVFGVVTAAIFVLVEWKVAKYPLMPTRIFKYRSNVAALGVCFCHGFVFIAGSYYLPLYFQASLGKTPILSGVYILPQSVALSVASIATGIFIRKTGQYLPPIIFGLCFMTLGFGLFIDLDRDSSLAKIIIYQVIAGLGVGPNFQAPLIALQTLVAPRDIASAVGTFGFTRQIATATSVVVGGVVFSNVMSSKGAMLAAELGPSIAQQLGGGNAGANVDVVDALPEPQRFIAQSAFAKSLQPMWIMYTAVAAVGIVFGCLITRQTLQRTHEETKTGLEAEEQNRLDAKQTRNLAAEKRAERQAAKADRVAGKHGDETVLKADIGMR